MTHSIIDRIAGRFAATGLGRRARAYVAQQRRRRVQPHWTDILGVTSAAALVVLFVTGILLMFVYSPSSGQVVYDGPWAPLVGQHVSKAYASTMRISLEVRGGLLVRQAHHWAALLLPASVIMQLLTSFFTGAFRRPRRASWVLLYLFFFAVLAGGWSGYALPDDLLAGTGLRIAQGVALSIPFVGTRLAHLLFGGPFPSRIIEHLYPLHVAVVPVALLALVVLLGRAGRREAPPRFAHPGRPNDEVRVWPTAAVRRAGLFAVAVGVLAGMAALVTIAPIWVFGPSSAGDASAGSQPDWYTGFLDGALRLVPPGWEFEWLGHTWSPALLLPLAATGLFLVAGFVYPFLEERLTRDRAPHHLRVRPRNAPVRTGAGVAAITFYGALWGAGSADIAATHFMLSVESVVHFYQALVLLGPAIAFELTRRVCVGLQRKDREILVHGFETGRIVRLPGGRFAEVHQQVPSYERWRYLGAGDESPSPSVTAGPGARSELADRSAPAGQVDPTHEKREAS